MEGSSSNEAKPMLTGIWRVRINKHTVRFIRVFCVCTHHSVCVIVCQHCHFQCQCKSNTETLKSKEGLHLQIFSETFHPFWMYKHTQILCTKSFHVVNRNERTNKSIESNCPKGNRHHYCRRCLTNRKKSRI